MSAWGRPGVPSDGALIAPPAVVGIICRPGHHQAQGSALSPDDASVVASDCPTVPTHRTLSLPPKGGITGK